MASVDSASNERTVNNTMRHQYRVLSDAEKANMVAIKDKGLEFLELVSGQKTVFQDEFCHTLACSQRLLGDSGG